ncbi:MAG: hypothetical protein AAF652_18845 [Cyanobacteria bacterium P01_C01_bin.72]
MYLIQHPHPIFILEELFCDLDDYMRRTVPLCVNLLNLNGDRN